MPSKRRKRDIKVFHNKTKNEEKDKAESEE
jgi:hypothetical protein